MIPGWPYPYLSHSADMSVSDVEAKMSEIEQILEGARKATPESRLTRGGMVVLVSTGEPIAEWQPVATRDLGDGVKWEW
jgi:hypothetical protein